MIKLTNDFHGTTATIRPHTIGQTFLGLNRAAVRRIKSKLCGVAKCTCGDALGARGGIRLDLIEIDRNGMHVFQRAD